jgi:hypothetical protein
MQALKAQEKPPEPKKVHLQEVQFTNPRHNKNSSHYEQPQKQRSYQSQPFLNKEGEDSLQLARKPAAKGKRAMCPACGSIHSGEGGWLSMGSSPKKST